MTFCAKSKVGQWTSWLCAALALLAAYVVVSRLVFGSVGWNVLDPLHQRLVLPLVLLFWFFAWETRWDGVVRERKSMAEGQGQEGRADEQVGGRGSELGQGNLTAGAAGPRTSALADVSACGVRRQNGKTASEAPRQREELGAERHAHPSFSSYSPSRPSADETGEELYIRARGVKHRAIPDFKKDADYLELLGKSAAKGYSPAMAKLGVYAMRRAAWVEAYYWVKQARRNGMHGLSPMLREIRKSWSRDGFPDQSSNVNKLFPFTAGSIGRALLHVDSGHKAAKAKEFLKTNFPEFLQKCD